MTTKHHVFTHAQNSGTPVHVIMGWDSQNEVYFCRLYRHEEVAHCIYDSALSGEKVTPDTIIRELAMEGVIVHPLVKDAMVSDMIFNIAEREVVHSEADGKYQAIMVRNEFSNAALDRLGRDIQNAQLQQKVQNYAMA